MILVDTSAWIELLRGTGHPAHLTLRHHLERRSPLVTTEPILMELLAGARSATELKRLRLRLSALPLLSVRGRADFEAAAWLFRLTHLDPKTDQDGKTEARRLFDEMVAAGKPADHYRAGLVLMNNVKLEPLCFLPEPDLPAARALFIRAKAGGVAEAAVRLAEVEALLKK